MTPVRPEVAPMPDAPTMNGTILVYLADQVGRVAAEVARVTDAVYGLDDPLIREQLDTLRAVERSMRALAAGQPQP